MYSPPCLDARPRRAQMILSRKIGKIEQELPAVVQSASLPNEVER